MSAPPESIILVEGFDDRDFWKGLLLRLACKDARKAPPSSHRQAGRFTYLTPAGKLLHLIPFKSSEDPSGSELKDVTKLFLKERTNKPVERLVLSPDADTHATLADAHASVRAIVTAACPDVIETEDGDLLVDGGKLVISALFMHAGEDAAGQRSPGVPAQRALEQLACAALCQVYPERGEAVARWLASRPFPHGKDHKAHAWSFYAGWSTDHGTGDFYGSLWREERVAVALTRLLRAQGAFRIIEALVGA